MIQILAYTWSSGLWNRWYARKEGAMTQEERTVGCMKMFEKVGFSIDLVGQWSEYIKLLMTHGQDREFVLEELHKGLMIGLSNPGPLLDLLDDLKPEKALKIITKYGENIRPQFFVNASRLCRNDKRPRSFRTS
jgi:hypothetical protein